MREVLDGEDQSKEEDLQDRVKVHTGLGHVLGEGRLGVLAWLLKEEQEAIPELHSRKRRQSHEQKDTVQDRHRKQLQHSENQKRQSDHQMGKEEGQASLLDRCDLAVTVLLGECVEVDDARHRCGNQPRKSKHSVDQVENSIQAEIVVVCLAVLQVIVGVIDQVPGDAIIKEDQEKAEEGGACRHNRNPALAVHVREVNKPRTSTCRLRLFHAVIRKESGASRITALESRFELIRHIQLLRLGIGEQELATKRRNKDSRSNSEVVDRGAYGVIAEERRILERAKEEDQGSCTKTEDGTEHGGLQVVVVSIIDIVFMRRVVRIEVAEDTNVRKRISNGVQHKDAHNEQGKDLVGETSGHTNHSRQVEECSDEGVAANPD